MSTSAAPETPARGADIEALYHQILAGWNQRDAQAMAAPFAADGNVVGFDGSQMAGRDSRAIINNIVASAARRMP